MLLAGIVSKFLANPLLAFSFFLTNRNTLHPSVLGIVERWILPAHPNCCWLSSSRHVLPSLGFRQPTIEPVLRCEPYQAGPRPLREAEWRPCVLIFARCIPAGRWACWAACSVRATR